MLTDLEIVAALPHLATYSRGSDAEFVELLSHPRLKRQAILPEIGEGLRFVREARWPEVEELLKKLARRSVRLGVEAPTLEVVEIIGVPVVGIFGNTWAVLPEMGRYRVVRAETRPIKSAGWTFVATIQHLGEDGNLLKTVPGFVGDLPKAYRTDAPTCDHCRTLRKRQETFVLRHEDGRLCRIGRNCIVDFLGSANADRCVDRAEMDRSMMEGLSDPEEGGFFRRGVNYASPERFLSVVVLLLRKVGWLSRSAARETGRKATADLAWALLFPMPKQSPILDSEGEHISLEDVTEEMKGEAQAALGWARDLDAEQSSDFLFNLRVMARQGSWTAREVGLGGAIAMSYAKEQDRLCRMAFERALPSLPLGPEKLRVGAGKGKKAVAPVRATVLGTWTRDGDYGPTTIVRMQAVSETPGHVHDLVWFASGACITAAVMEGEQVLSAREIVAGDVVDITGTLGPVMKSDKTGRISTKLSRCALVGVIWAPRRD